MRLLFWLLLLASLAVATALLANNEGFALFILPPWRVDVSLNVLLLILLLALCLINGLIAALRLAFGLPARARAWRVRQESEIARKNLTDALGLLFAGRYGHALRAADKVWQSGHMGEAASLLAARAAQRMREEDKNTLWLTRAAHTGGNANTITACAIDMIGTEMAQELGKHAKALEHLAALQKKQGRHIAALRLELKSRQGMGDIPAVLKIARQLEKRGGMDATVAQEIRSKAHQEALRQRENDADALITYFDALPENEQTPRLSITAARNLAQISHADQAARILEAIVERMPDTATDWLSDVAQLYGQLPAGNGKALTARIACAEKWLVTHQRNADLLLALGQLCGQQQLWGKARRYLETALSLAPSRATHLALARLLDQLEETEAANRHYRLAADAQ
jgi:HemY protein